MGVKTALQRRRRVADTLAWRARQKRGAAVYPLEVDGRIFDLMGRFGGLASSQEGNKQAVADALRRLLDRALAALLREANSQH